MIILQALNAGFDKMWANNNKGVRIPTSSLPIAHVPQACNITVALIHLDGARRSSTRTWKAQSLAGAGARVAVMRMNEQIGTLARALQCTHARTLSSTATTALRRI